MGTVQTEWLPDGRRMRLLAPLTYVDPKDRGWHAPKDSIVDGASIPRFAWSLIGGPFEGKYRNASVIHDVACEQKTMPWEDVHEVFYWGMLASGVEMWLAKTMYWAVHYGGPRWPRTVLVKGFTQAQASEARVAALAQADRASTAEILAFRPATLSYPPRPAEFDVRITPPPSRPDVSNDDFEKLKQRIEERERAGAGFSLSELRELQP